MDARKVTEAEARLKALLGPERPGEVRWLRETDSTNRQLRLLAEAGAPAGTVLLSEGQTDGRGRMGRSFASPPGKGLYLSLLLRPRDPDFQPGLLTPRAALAVSRAVTEVCGLRPSIKWVNDLLCGDRKLCGILTEGSFREGRLRYAVVGVGLNVSSLPEDFPPELREKVTSLLLEGGTAPDRAVLAAAAIRELDRLSEVRSSGGGDWLPAYRAACVTLSRRVRLNDGAAGVAEDVAEDGALLVRLPDGTLRRVQSGEAVTPG